MGEAPHLSLQGHLQGCTMDVAGEHRDIHGLGRSLVQSWLVTMSFCSS